MKKTLILLLLMAAATCGAAAQTALKADTKLRYAGSIIERFYVDSIDANHVAEEGIKAMLKTLDPHSQYSNAEETRELNEPLEGNFSGIGIQFNMATDTLYVIQTVAGGPSEKVGILAGDRILAANDSLISGVKMKNSEVMKRLRGPKGTTVKLQVLRRGVDRPLEFMVKRDDIPIYSVDAYYMAAPEVGYIKVTRFAETTADEVKNALKELKRKGMKHLILDLEDNGGGYLNAAVEMAEMMLKPGELIVYTKGDKVSDVNFTSHGKPMLDAEARLVVMVNQYSASASEIMSGAVQDNDRGLIVGRRTFGKGLVQRPFPFPDGSMIRLTVARYYTPSGRCIQKPYGEDEDDYSSDILHRYQSGELSSADSIHLNTSERFSTAHGRTVYGGGGIMPDRFVPIDTTFYSDYYRDLVAKGALNRFTQEYIDENRAQLKKRFKTDDDFVKSFEVTDEMMNSIYAIATKEGVEFNEEQAAKSSPWIRRVVKALIGRDLYEQQTYYKVVNPDSPSFSEALRLILDEKEYNKLLTPQP